MEYVYIIGEPDGPVKIGFSTDPRARIASLKTAYPGPMAFGAHLPFDIDGQLMEGAIHAKLSHCRLKGEWFSIDGESALTAAIEVCKERGIEMERRQGAWPKHSEHITGKRVAKKLLTLRLDVDVIERFKATGRGWQARMNEVLKAARVTK